MGFIKKHVKLTLILAIVLIGSFWNVVKREGSYLTHLNRITNKFIQEVNEDYGLCCSGVGSSLAGNTKEISLNFFCYEKKSIEEARQLEVNCVERFHKMINSNKKISSYFKQSSFPKGNIGILISFCNKDLSNFASEESISLVMSCRENLIYKIEYNDQRPDETILRESYSEAYEKVNGYR